MPTAIYIFSDDSRLELEVPVGTSLMQAAVSNGIEGIVGDCGGSASCATCHVFVGSHNEHLPEISSNEDQMLECTAAERQAGSRLSCQLVMTEELDGITVYVADPQL